MALQAPRKNAKVVLPEPPPPDKIIIKEGEFTKTKLGVTTVARRRKNSQIVKGKVRGNRKFFTDKEKMEAACAFAVTGNSRRTAEITKIAECTIRAWKQTEWWNEIQSKIVKEQDEELDTKLTKLVDKAVDQVNDRLDSGDYLYDAKNQKMVRKPINGKDLAIITAITVDKRQLLRGLPTSRTEKVSQDERLLKLAEQFKSFVGARDITPFVEVEGNDQLESPSAG
jgi:hypothetical protein